MLLYHNQTGAEILASGDIKQIWVGDIKVNQLYANTFDPMVSNLFLRIFTDNSIQYYPLIGQNSNSSFSINEATKQVQYMGTIDEINYQVYFTLRDTCWFYDIKLSNTGNSDIKVDVVYGQDVGLATKGHIQSNEIYNSQYIDHKAFANENGYVLCSRQNQLQPTGNPGLMIASLQKTIGYSTDGYQFFGLSYKWDNTIEALTKPLLANHVYQHEYAYLALQSEAMTLQKNKTYTTTYYGCLQLNHTKSITKPFENIHIKDLHNKITFKEQDSFTTYTPALSFNTSVYGEDFTIEEINQLYPSKSNEEYNGNELISFFANRGSHIVLNKKEQLVERSHGHIILTGNTDYISDKILSTTNYMYGVFSSQTVLGNTNFNKLSSHQHNSLNANKSSGQRVFIEIDGTYRLLTMPSIFEIGLNYSKWLYKIDNDILELRTYATLDQPVIRFECFYHSGKPVNALVYHQLNSAPDEYEVPLTYIHSDNKVTVQHAHDTLSGNIYPQLSFDIISDNPFSLHDQSLFTGSTTFDNEPILVWKYENQNKITQTIVGCIDENKVEASTSSFEKERDNYRTWMLSTVNGFNLKSNSNNTSLQDDLTRLNETVLWYSHNARIHYSSPHGLEQHGGAAWGTRDVCQGPFEYFLTTHKFDVNKQILKMVYEKQFIEDGDWPQWFMFDKYSTIQAEDSHGDIIVWPLKALTSYLSATNDQSILEEKVVYTAKDGRTFTDESYPLLHHITKQIETIKSRYIKGTHLSCYGEGDWDDTLQPYDLSLREKMASSWTVALTYQTFSELSEALGEKYKELSFILSQEAKAIKEDYGKYLLKDGVTTGFLLLDGEKRKYMLHPSDNETGLNYRLLPMIRSMISEMFTPEQSEHHFDLIKNHLYHTDGVRLMNTTCNYTGGTNTYFRRAETSAAFGREIGLQYVHAHIRFIEAMAKTGRADETWDNILKITPINLSHSVKNAAFGQSNTYFSSSDADFKTRYEAMDSFDKLRTGDIHVRRGWRIYSSGPGIFLHQLISNVLGIRVHGNSIILDPVLPKKCDQLEFEYSINNHPVTIRYHVEGIKKITVDQQDVPYSEVHNTYRSSGFAINSSLIKDNSVIDIYI